jgi:hypothetical protein
MILAGLTKRPMLNQWQISVTTHVTGKRSVKTMIIPWVCIQALTTTKIFRSAENHKPSTRDEARVSLRITNLIHSIPLIFLTYNFASKLRDMVLCVKLFCKVEL